MSASKTLRQPFLLLVIGVMLLCAAQATQAALVQLTFSGSIDKISGSGITGINLGDPVSGTLIYDSSIPDENSNSQIGLFPDAIMSYYASIGAKTFYLYDVREYDRSEIAITDNSEVFVTEYQDSMKFAALLRENENTISHILELYFSTITSTPSTWIDTSSVLPLPTDIDLSAADTTTGNMRLDPFSKTNSVWFTISDTTMTVVTPIPATAWLFASGLFALVGMARRNKA